MARDFSGIVSNTVGTPLNIMGAFDRAHAGKTQPQQTLISKIMPDRKPAATVAGVEGLKRDANLAAPDLQSAKTAAAGVEADVKQDVANMEAGWDQARKAIIECATEVAADTPSLGVSAESIQATCSAQSETTLVDAAVTAGVNTLAQGAGTMVTFALEGGSGVGELREAAKEMTPGAFDDLMQATAARLNHQADRIAMQFDGKAGVTPTNINLAGFTGEELGRIVSEPFAAQPEAVEASNTLAAIGDVHANHAAVEENALNGEGAFEDALERGDMEMAQTIAENPYLSAAAVDETIHASDQAARIETGGPETFRLGALDAHDRDALIHGGNNQKVSEASKWDQDREAELQALAQRADFEPPTPFKTAS